MNSATRGYNSFDKTCEKCGERKHVAKFRVKNKIYKYCNECNNKMKKICGNCNLEKPLAQFYRNSRNHLICNNCEGAVENTKAESMKIAFGLFDKLTRGEYGRVYAN